MPTFLESVETIGAEEASIHQLFGGDTKVRERRQTPAYRSSLLEAMKFIDQIQSGRRPSLTIPARQVVSSM